MGDPSRVRVTGPLQPYAAGFGEELARLGYTKHSASHQLLLLAHLSRWLSSEGLHVSELTPAITERFLEARRAAGYRMWLSPKALAPMLSYLRALGVVPPAPVPVLGPAEALLARYQAHLISHRGVTAESARGYGYALRPFLRRHQSAHGALDLAGLTPGDVTSFVVSHVPGLRRGSAKLTVSALRSLLQFLHVEGIIPESLTMAVPSVASWRLAGLPKALEPEQVNRLLASCNRDTLVGRRDFAILTMLARLGLRAGEIARLKLDDIDWRRGEIAVRGKGNRYERLPLPVDVGSAVAEYLRHGRPVEDSRQLFLRVRAPHRGLSSSGITQVVFDAARRANLALPMAAHRLRHTAATQMLRAGASLAEVGQVLRHRSPVSTAMYAKVDRERLRTVARPWPSEGVA